MATIEISDLRPAGSELFSDSEGYMNELGESEFGGINGGSTPMCVFATITLSLAVGSNVLFLTYALNAPRRR